MCGLICLCGVAVIPLGSKVFSHNLGSCKDLYLFTGNIFLLYMPVCVNVTNC